MRNNNKAFTPFECVMVVTILMFVAGVAIRNVARSIRDSEENTIQTATTEYSAVRNMYAAEYRAVPVSVSGANATANASEFTAPVH